MALLVANETAAAISRFCAPFPPPTPTLGRSRNHANQSRTITSTCIDSIVWPHIGFNKNGAQNGERGITTLKERGPCIGEARTAQYGHH